MSYRARVTAQPLPHKRRSGLHPAIIVVLVVAAVCAAGTLFFFVRLFTNLKAVVDEEKAVNDATAAYIEDRRDGLGEAGYAALCDEAKEEYAAGTLAVAPAGDEAITGYQFTLDTHVQHERGTADVRVDITRADGSTTEEMFFLEQDGDTWRLCGLPF